MSCLTGFFKLPNLNYCVSAEECPIFTYAEIKTQTCEACFRSCETCYGPAHDECVGCNFEKGYKKSAIGNGLCNAIVCQEGFYLDIDVRFRQAICSKCSDQCLTCFSYSECIECKPGFKNYYNSTSCTDCMQLSNGYTKSRFDNNCQGIYLLLNAEKRNMWRWYKSWKTSM